MTFIRPAGSRTSNAPTEASSNDCELRADTEAGKLVPTVGRSVPTIGEILEAGAAVRRRYLL